MLVRHPILRTLALAAIAMMVAAAPAAARAPEGPPNLGGHGMRQPEPMSPEAQSQAGQWTMAGQNIHNTRDQASEHLIGPGNVNRLVPRWVFTTGGDVSATPTVEGGVVYFPDTAGNLFAVNARTGKAIWTRQVPDYPGLPPTAFVRTSPLIYGNELILGDQHPFFGLGNGAHIFAVSRSSGRLLWMTTVAKHPAAFITGSPVLFRGVVYVGVSSSEEAAATLPGYPCCTFRGSIVALDASNGHILWKTHTVPPPPPGAKPGSWYSGGPVWASTPVVDARLGLLIVGTGNNYTVPAGVCQTPTQTGCQEPAANDHEDSMLGLSLRTGAVRWATRLERTDAFTIATKIGPDFDLGSGPNLFHAFIGGRRQTLVGVGQKSGIYWALNPTTGAVVWHTQVGPAGSTAGGIEWGGATDGRRIYVASANTLRTCYTLVTTGQQNCAGAWNALDPATGKILWQTPDPSKGLDTGFVSTANGVVYAGSLDPQGHMYAMDAATGKILWSFASGGSVAAGPSIVGNSLYWGSGYRKFAAILGTTGNDRLFAFSLPQTQHPQHP